MTEETTPISNSKREMPVIEDDAFSYEGYQIVRGEFFAHTYEKKSAASKQLRSIKIC